MADMEYKNGALCVNKLNISDAETYTIDNPEWFHAVIDASSKLICGIKQNGNIYANELESKTIDSINKSIKTINDELNNLDFDTIYKSFGNISDLGNLDYQQIGDTDYSQIIMYGQSLSMGWECPDVISTVPIDGNYMVGNNVLINHGNNHVKQLYPLVANKSTVGGEQPIVGCVNSFSKLYRKFVNKDQFFIAGSAGEGGQSIERLSKECTNCSGEVVTNNYYHIEFLRLLEYTKNTIDSLEGNKTVGCSAILYMQGEHNYSGSGLGLTPGTEATKDKDQYKAYLMTLKNNMQNDIMSIYGQSKKPLFFIYEVCGAYINLKDMPINMAQVEFALENDDVFLLNPTYFTPDYGGGHLSTNGYRWYGEIMAKSLYKVLIKGEKYNPIIYPLNISAKGKNVYIDLKVPVPPLVFDNWTKEEISKYGFKVYVNNSDVNISSLYIDGNRIILSCDSEITGELEVTYAGYGRSGSGNLRDSDEFHALCTYYDDSESQQTKPENYTPRDKNGNKIYGEYYPLWNWCANFYKKITIN